MSYIMWVLCVGIFVGLYGLCCSSVTYFGVVCMVVSSLFCCGLIAVLGGGFMSLLLFIVYLGGMMVVFAYSVAMTEGLVIMKGQVFIKSSVVLCSLVGLGFVWGYWTGSFNLGLLTDYEGLVFFSSLDGVGVSLLYSLGWCGLVVCAWSLLLALFVVVEMVRGGVHGGGLRSV